MAGNVAFLQQGKFEKLHYSGDLNTNHLNTGNN